MTTLQPIDLGEFMKNTEIKYEAVPAQRYDLGALETYLENKTRGRKISYGGYSVGYKVG